MKRHGFAGLRASHGTSVSHRSHGSTGQHQVSRRQRAESVRLAGSGLALARGPALPVRMFVSCDRTRLTLRINRV